MQDRRLIDEVRRRHEPDLAEPMLDLGTTHFSSMPVFSWHDLDCYYKLFEECLEFMSCGICFNCT